MSESTLEIDAGPEIGAPHSTVGRRRGAWRTILHAIVLLAVAGWALEAGVEARRWTWEMTEPIRFRSDISRNFYWGYEGVKGGLLSLYDRQVNQEPRARLWLDYAPLRLTLMNLWARATVAKYPDATAWRGDFEFNRPLLRVNTAMSLLMAAAAFFLVHHWVRRDRRARGGVNGPLTGANAATVAALLVWFSPAVLISTHGWPTYDLYIIPFFLWAVYLASRGWWFSAGVMIAIGAMFKGQQLTMVPLFLLWPLFMKRPGAMLRWTAGMLAGLAAVALPWVMSYLPHGDPAELRAVNWTAAIWVMSVWGVATAPLAIGYWARSARAKRWARLIVALMPLALLWPWIAHPLSIPAEAWGFIAAASVLLATIRLRHYRFVIPGLCGGAVLMSMFILNGSSAWMKCGWGFGLEHWPHMSVGSCYNLPTIIGQAYGWRDVHATLFTWGGQQVSIRAAFNTVFFMVLALSAWGVARRYRRDDAWFLVAISTPYLLFFNFPVQVHERYLLFGATVGLVCIGRSVGMTLLAVLLSLQSGLMTMDTMIGANWRARGATAAMKNLWGEGMFDFLEHVREAANPHLGWATFLAALVFLWVGLTARRSPTLEGPGRAVAPSQRSVDDQAM